MAQLVGEKLGALCRLDESTDRSFGGVGRDELVERKETKCLPLHFFFRDQSPFHEGLNPRVGRGNGHIEVQTGPEQRSVQCQLQVHRDAAGEVICFRKQGVKRCACCVRCGDI